MNICFSEENSRGPSSNTMIKPEINRAYYVRVRPAARPDECVDSETGDRGVRIRRLP